MSYKFYATSSSILFEGTYQLLGYEVPLYIYFQPHRLENGAVQLQVISFQWELCHSQKRCFAVFEIKLQIAKLC